MSFVFESAEAFSAGMVRNHISAAMQPALYSRKESSSCHYDREDQGAEKKRRLTVEQAKSLERSFEREKKLEHERKMQLAFELGLKPRQVAVWYQNRRARWKAKQLEQDYDILKEQYQRMLLEKQKLEGEVIRLTAEVRLAERQMAERPMKEENITSGCSYGTKEEEENGEKRSSSVRSDGASKPCIGQAVAEPDHGTRLLQCHMSQTPVSSEDVEQSERNSYQQIVAKSGDNNDNIVSQQFYESDLMSLDGQQGMTAGYFDWFNF